MATLIKGPPCSLGTRVDVYTYYIAKSSDIEDEESTVFSIPMAPSCDTQAYIARVGQRDAKYCGSHWPR